MEAVEDDPDRGMTRAADDFPGIAIVVDITSPGERLEADTQASLGRPLSQLAEVIGGAVDAAEREWRNIAAHEQEIGAQLAHQVELLLSAAESEAALRLGHSLEIAE